MKRVWMLSSLALALSSSMLIEAQTTDGTQPRDYAYRMEVAGPAGAAAYRVTLPLSLYQKVVHSDLSDLRVFNASGEQVPFAVERPTEGKVSGTATALPLFPLADDSNASVDALRVTIESGKNAVNVQTSGTVSAGDRIRTYLLDGRGVEVAVAGLRLSWPDDAADFAGRIRVEGSDNLADWHIVAAASPVANLHADNGRLIEQQLELAPTKARYWRLSWVGTPAPFVLTSVLGDPAKQNATADRGSLTVPLADPDISSTAEKHAAGEFEYVLRARVPVDRVNLDLPEDNTVVQVELLSRNRSTAPWRTVCNCGFYRLNSDGTQLRNGAVPVPINIDSYWLLRTDPGKGGLGKMAPHLVVQWVPHELVFVARGAGPFYLGFGSAVVDTPAAVSLALLPEGLTIAAAALADPQPLGGDDRLKPPPEPYAWKAVVLWSVLIAAAALLAWMALRLSKDIRRG